jgi:hypothetical protein
VTEVIADGGWTNGEPADLERKGKGHVVLDEKDEVSM